MRKFGTKVALTGKIIKAELEYSAAMKARESSKIGSPARVVAQRRLRAATVKLNDLKAERDNV